jgi:hypothetical protein
MKESSHSGLPRSREDATLVECHSDRSTGSDGTAVLLHQHPKNKAGRLCDSTRRPTLTTRNF